MDIWYLLNFYTGLHILFVNGIFFDLLFYLHLNSTEYFFLLYCCSTLELFFISILLFFPIEVVWIRVLPNYTRSPLGDGLWWIVHHPLLCMEVGIGKSSTIGNQRWNRVTQFIPYPLPSLTHTRFDCSL